MFPADNRLGRSEGFDQTIRKGRRQGSRYMVVHLLLSQTPSSAPPKLGVTVAKRQVAKATDRSRLKRQLRHIAIENLHALPSGSKLVVRGLAAARGKTSKQLNEVLADLLSRALGPERQASTNASSGRPASLPSTPPSS